MRSPSISKDHRGTRGLAPENTLAAFRRALEIGVTTIETDMAVTKDDVIVISHDPLLNPDLVRGSDGQWLASHGPPIRTLTLAELRRYDIGRLNPTSQYAKQFPEQRAVDGERFPQLSELSIWPRRAPSRCASTSRPRSRRPAARTRRIPRRLPGSSWQPSAQADVASA